MGRLTSILSVVCLLALFGSLLGCGGSSHSGTSTTLPASINLTPNISSVDLGATLSLTATAKNYAGNPVTLSYTWSSSNPAVATVSTNGLVCAGVWDSLTVPVVCNPGGVGSAQITASVNGISSGPATIYVHPHVDHIAISALPQPAGVNAPVNGCYSTTTTTQPAQTQSYQAAAFSNGTDISALVGPFTWSATSAQVVTLKELTGTNGVVNGQVEVTAKVPGETQIFASIANTNSSVGSTSPLQTFETCPVQSITLAISSGGTTFSGAKGAGFNITATVVDSNQQTITNVPLTWTSTQPEVATVSATGGVSNSNPGGATITASCTPPSCNVGLTSNSVPMQAVYATDPITANWSTTSTTPTAPTVYVSSTGCSSSGVSSSQNCTTAILPIVGLPATLQNGAASSNIPNSMVFDPKGSTLYVGSDNGLLQLAAGTPPTLSIVSTAVKGKILAISPDSRQVIVSDTKDTPNQVFLYNANNTAAPVTNFLITGATAASFSPDGLKAFIVAHDASASPADHLYVYSSQMPLQTIPMGAQAFDLAFPGNGMFGFLAGGDASGSSYLPVCDSAAPPGVGAVGGAPGSLIRALPGNSFLVLDPPNVYRADFNVTGPAAPSPTQVGCPVAPLGPPPGMYTPSFTVSGATNLGQGSFTPVAFSVSSDGRTAYVLAPNVGSLIVYDVQSQTTSTIALVGSPAPLAGALSPDGLTFYVTGSDNNLHVINLVAGGDVQQLAIPSQNLCAVGSGTAPTCSPNLLALP